MENQPTVRPTPRFRFPQPQGPPPPRPAPAEPPRPAFRPPLGRPPLLQLFRAAPAQPQPQRPTAPAPAPAPARPSPPPPPQPQPQRPPTAPQPQPSPPPPPKPETPSPSTSSAQLVIETIRTPSPPAPPQPQPSIDKAGAESYPPTPKKPSPAPSPPQTPKIITTPTPTPELPPPPPPVRLSPSSDRKFHPEPEPPKTPIAEEEKKVPKQKRGTTGEGEVGTLRVITIAGENKGAYMELTPSYSKVSVSQSRKKLDKIASPLHYGRILNDQQEDVDAGAAANDGKSNVGKTSKGRAAYFVNSNVQSINNSIVLNSSCTHKDPGVHLALSNKKHSPASIAEDLANARLS